jgi:DNA repair protein RecO (recombination protein O)
MEWQDEGIIIGVRRHGETGAIVEAMTSGHGRHLGLVRGGRSRRMRPVLQPGNSIDMVWRARLSEHLGNFAVEPSRLRAAALMQAPVSLYGLQLLGAHLRLLPERDPHRGLYDASLVVLEHLDEPRKAAHLIVRFELALLDELGFGLDLSSCAATGSAEDLAWVSPKSGRAVSRAAGAPYAARLLGLPGFLLSGGQASANNLDAAALGESFALAGHFLERHVWTPRGLKPPEERAAFIRSAMAAWQIA